MSESEEYPERTRQNLKEHFEKERGRIAWSQLDRFFAAGVVLEVESRLDLIDTAVAMALDEKGAVEKWVESGRLQAISDEVAREWFEGDTLVDSVVVPPWVLVQTLE